MSTLILATKLYIPHSRPKVVPRPRLMERLNEGLRQNQGFGRKLTLISAPAGFGKTTLVSEWIDHLAMDAAPESPSVHQIAWLSLDEGEKDLSRFLAYLIAALQSMGAKLGEGALALLQSPQPPAPESILAALINEITTVLEPFILVLDDYHVIDASAVDHALTFLLDHLPPQMHLVITTREDPSLPLSRYRARGQMTELRAADLRFTPAEAAGFLNQAMGLSLSAEEVAALERRTEGWIAGLQMAALALQGTAAMPGRDDSAHFIQAFTGSHRFVLDYLVEEVLQRQPEGVRNFLLQSSILDRLSGPLCDAVTGDGGSQGLLMALERGNLFVVPLDDTRQWYRYHHLFAEVLQARAMEQQPEQIPILHQRASGWYEQNGLRAEAIHHALAAADFERAAALIELAWPAMDGSFQSATWLDWVKALPEELIRARPVLSVAYGWALLNGGEMEAAAIRLGDGERWLEPNSGTTGHEMSNLEMTVVDSAQFQSLPASIATARAYHAQAFGDQSGTLTHARRALDLLAETDYLRRGPAAAILGLAQWGRGELEVAHRSLADAMTGFQLAGNMHFAISGTYGLADIRIAQGRLREAVSTYERALQLVAELNGPMIRGTADLYLGLSELYRERDDPEAAIRSLQKSEELGEQAALQDWPYRLHRARARMAQDRGDLDGALALLDEAERFYFRSPVPDLHPIAGLKSQVWIAQGRLTEALGWVHERGLSVDDDLSYLREFEHMTLARLLMAQYKSDRADRSIYAAMGLLDRLLQAAQDGERMGSILKILVLQALAHAVQGNISPALVPLERALTLAEPEGYVRLFVDEGPPMAALLKEAAKQEIAPAYLHRLRAVFGGVEATSPITQDLIEPLSDRELEVLQLLGTELNGPEIAQKLMISLNTLRTHTKNIYSKLGAGNRRAAIRRAEELDLL